MDKQIFKKLFVMLGMSSSVAGVFIAIMTYINLGVHDEFFPRWYKSLFFAVVFMIPFAGMIMFVADKVIDKLLPNVRELLQNIMVGFIMALSMEAIMAVSTTFNTIGFGRLEEFSSVWMNNYLAALPFAIIFAPIMAIYIKPKIEAYLARD